MAEAIRTVIAGATGKTGSCVASGLMRAQGIELVGAVSRRNAGSDLGEALGVGPWRVPVLGSVVAALDSVSADVLVDFTDGQIAGGHALLALDRGVRPVIGATGLPDGEVEDISRRCESLGFAAVLIANFSVGAHLLFRLARQAASVYHQAEIIEMHHDQKRDAPSGTAIRLRQAIEDGSLHGVPVHSVRLPGIVAHHSALFGGEGETLTISHDTTSRSAFVPGVVRAVLRVSDLSGLVTDMDDILDG